MLINIEGLFLSMLLLAWARACVHSLDSCVHSSILAYATLFLRLYVRGDGSAYAGSCLRTWALTHVCETPGRGLILPPFTSFSTMSLLHVILTHLFVIFAPKQHCILLFIFILASKTSFFFFIIST